MGPRMLRTALACFCFIAVLAGLPLARAQDANAPVATVNGVPIPQSTFQKALRAALNRGGQDTPELRAAVKNQLIARELFAQEAKKRKLDTDPRVVEAAEEARTNAMVTLYLNQVIKPQAATEADLHAQYEKIKASLGPDEYKLRIIVTHEKARAEEALAAARQGRPFAQLAQQYSVAPTARRGGELDWVSFKSPAREGETNGLPLAVAQAVERMKPGDVSDPLSVNNQWLIVQLEEKRPTVVMSFEQAKPALQRMLTARAVERATSELVRSLASGAKITQ
jgi:peptidyl-prolyl cis-trans isomerase C